MQAKTFPSQTLDAVPVHGVAYLLPGNGQPQSGLTLITGTGKHGQISIRRLLRTCEDILVIGGFAKTIDARKAEGLRSQTFIYR